MQKYKSNGHTITPKSKAKLVRFKVLITGIYIECVREDGSTYELPLAKAKKILLEAINRKSP